MDENERVVYLIRHGESEGNIKPVFQSLIEPLSIDGIKQAKKLAKRVGNNIKFDKLISSPILRTHQTAKEISKITGHDINFSDLFIEVDIPKIMHNKPLDDPYYVDLREKRNDTLRKPNLKIDDAENFDELMARVDSALDTLKNDDSNSIVVVTHGFFIRAIISRVLFGNDLTPDAFWRLATRINTANTGMTQIKYMKLRDTGEYNWRMIFMNDHSHLN